MNNYIFSNHATISDIDEMINLDKLVYKDCDIVNNKLVYKWHKKNDKIWTIIKENNKIIGYINFIPITDKCYHNLKDKKYSEHSIKYNDIMSYKKDMESYFLFDSIVIHPNYQNKNITFILFKFFIKNTLKFFKENNIKIKSIIAQVVNNKIDNILSKKGFNLLFTTENFKFFEGNINI